MPFRRHASFALAASLLLACSDHDSSQPSPDAAPPDATTPQDASPEAGGQDASPEAAPPLDASSDSAPDAPSDSSADAPSDAPSDAAADAPADAGADALDGGDAGPPADGVQVTPPLPSGSTALPDVRWLGGGENGPLVLQWDHDDSFGPPYFQTFTAVSESDGGTTALVDISTNAPYQVSAATNGSVLVYWNPDTTQVLSVPTDGSAPPRVVANGYCPAIGVDATYVYCGDFGGKGLILERTPLAADAGTLEQFAYTLGYATPKILKVIGPTLYVGESVTSDGGVTGYAIASYPVAGLPDGGAPTILASGDGTLMSFSVSGAELCWSWTLSNQYAITCAEPGVSPPTDVVPLGAAQLAGLALDTGTLWFGTSRAIERLTVPSTTATTLSGAYETYLPTLAIDATRVYWADFNGSIRAVAR